MDNETLKVCLNKIRVSRDMSWQEFSLRSEVKPPLLKKMLYRDNHPSIAIIEQIARNLPLIEEEARQLRDIADVMRQELKVTLREFEPTERLLICTIIRETAYLTPIERVELKDKILSMTAREKSIRLQELKKQREERLKNQKTSYFQRDGKPLGILAEDLLNMVLNIDTPESRF